MSVTERAGRAADPDTEPLPALAATAGLILGVFLPAFLTRPRRRGGRPPRHAAAPPRDPELVATGWCLVACGAMSAALVPWGLPQVAAWAWAVAGVTAWGLAATSGRGRSGDE